MLVNALFYLALVLLFLMTIKFKIILNTSSIKKPLLEKVLLLVKAQLIGGINKILMLVLMRSMVREI